MQLASPRGNLGPGAQALQMRAGLVALAMALVAAAALGRASSSYRALVFVPFFVAAYGVLSALYETCCVTALAGRRLTCQGAEPVADRAELHAQRSIGMRVLALSGALATGATALFVAMTP